MLRHQLFEHLIYVYSKELVPGDMKLDCTS
jgi:hypothetical protein